MFKTEFEDDAQVPSRRALSGCWVYVCLWCSFISFVFYRFRVMVWCSAWGPMGKVRLTRTGSWHHGEPCLTAWHRVRIVKDRGSREVNPATGLPTPGGLFMCVYL